MYYSFVDRDMFIRHFGHGVGHLQYEQLHKIESDHDHDTSMGRTLENDSDSLDDLDIRDILNTRDSDPDDRFAANLDKQEEYDSEIVDNDKGDTSDSVIVNNSDPDVDGSSDCDSSDGLGYASY